MHPTLLIVIVLGLAGDAEELRVLASPQGSEIPHGQVLYASLKREALAAFERRERLYEQVKTAEDVRRWQADRRAFFLRQIGGLVPASAPRAEKVGTLRGDGFRVEKLIYETRPHHHVTALLYLPEGGNPPFPGVLIACGHSANGKAYEPYQRMGILLAKNGMAALCYDPIAQGERSQILSAEGKPLYDCVCEHTLVGIGCILLGINTAHYRVWDGVQSLQYLQSRADIDPRRIGCAGNSGGGTETSYLMALDDRIACAAPGCYLTTFRRLLDSSGPQDAEQNLAGQIAFGLDEADYVILRAPRPTLICAATRDVTFDIAGTWEIFRQAKRVYSRLGYPERVDLAEPDEPHGFTRPLRDATARWMSRWLLGRDEPIVEPEFPAFTEGQVRCTQRGQVMLLPGEQSVMDFNREREARLAPQRRKLWAETPRPQMLARVRELIGARSPASVGVPQARTVGTLRREGYRVEKKILMPDPETSLPALDFFPDRRSGEVYLYLHSAGKQADAGPGGPIEALVRQGHRVLAVDLRGIGEIECKHPREWYRRLFGPNGREFFLAYLLGKSLVGLNTEDIWCCARFLAADRPGATSSKVRLVASGKLGIAALHATALEPELFASLTLRDKLPGWSEVLAIPVPREHLVNAVHGALLVYDLADLIRTLPPGFLTDP
jgi:dienelactone hydrolase